MLIQFYLPTWVLYVGAAVLLVLAALGVCFILFLRNFEVWRA